MLEEQKSIDLIEIAIKESKFFIQIRYLNLVLKDGAKIASSFERKVIHETDDRSELDPVVKKIADALWSE